MDLLRASSIRNTRRFPCQREPTAYVGNVSLSRRTPVLSQTSSRTRLERLSPLQIQEVAECRSRWSTIGLKTEPANREAAEEGVRKAYRAAGLPAPQIVWCQGPLEFANEWRNANRSVVGASVKREVYDHPLARVITHAESRVSLGVRHSVINGTRLPSAT